MYSPMSPRRKQLDPPEKDDRGSDERETGNDCPTQRPPDQEIRKKAATQQCGREAEEAGDLQRENRKARDHVQGVGEQAPNRVIGCALGPWLVFDLHIGETGRGPRE